MALSQADKILVAEYVGAGILAREIGDRLLSGRVTKAENSLFKSLVKFVGRAAGRAAVRGVGTAGMLGRAGFAASRAHPLLTAGAIAAIAYKQGVSLDTARDIAIQEVEAFRGQPQFFLEEQLAGRIGDVAGEIYSQRAPGMSLEERRGAFGLRKRKVSKANKAVKQGMTWLKAGGKAATGALPGKLPASAFRTAVKAAGMANPKTKSKPGKGKSIMNKLARRLKKWW